MFKNGALCINSIYIKMKIPKELVSLVNKFNTSEEFLRNGGIDVEILDEMER